MQLLVVIYIEVILNQNFFDIWQTINLIIVYRRFPIDCLSFT